MHDKNSTAPFGATNDEEELPLPNRIHETDYRQERGRNRTKMLYAIIDKVTNTIVGGILTHLNDQSAIRQLYDIAIADTIVNKHPLDFDLYALGALGEDHQLNANMRRILTGAQIEAIVNAANQKEPK